MYRAQEIRITEDLKEVIERVNNEFKQIEKVLGGLLQLQTTREEPAKPRDGMLVYVNGTAWNPGTGEGVYVYFNGVWNKL